MNVKDALKLAIDSSNMISMGYLQDLTDKEMFHRPCQGANHINWQVGHLVAAENQMQNQAIPGSMPPLPAGFAEKYTKETATSDDPAKFCTKAELLKAFETQREAVFAALEKVSEADLDKPTGVDYAKTIGAMFNLHGAHWLMHAGQWAVIRRQLGRPPLF